MTKGEMFVLGNFSEEAQLILLKAKDEMMDLNHPYIGTEHLVLSILKNEDEVSKKLSKYGLKYDSFRKEIIDIIGIGSKKSKFFLHTPLLKKVIENAVLDAKDFNHGEVTVEHLFSSLLEEGEGIAIRIFVGMGIDLEELYSEFNSRLIKRSKKRKKRMLVDDLGVNLVNKALECRIDPVVGREKEILSVIKILCRRNKNNPILIGEAGVGKTAIVEELAFRIAKGNVPSALLNKKIISVDMATMVAGTKYRGEFEERMQKLIKEVSDDGDIILFIDEIHTLVGAGGAEGAIDASNIMKPALARGAFRCIGATTTYEYQKYIEEDKALARRFQKVMVEEPSEEETINILEGVSSIYEKYHQVVISRDIIRKIVEMSNRYIFDRHNPDKSLDILDEVASIVSIHENINEKKYRDLKNKLVDVQEKKNSLILDHDMEKAYDYLKEEVVLLNKVQEVGFSMQDFKKEVTLEDVASVIHEKSGIPVYEIMKGNNNEIDKMVKELNDKIIGQDDAIRELINTTKRIKFLGNNHKIKSFLFVGPTGVGKTRLAKLYGAMLVGESNFIRLDMSEFSDVTAINKFIGSSPGYVGYHDNHTVLSQIKNKPNCVLLLDEIDKAHSSVINLLYQILDEGVIRDSSNNTIHLEHSVIIMTSNLGYENSKVGFNTDKIIGNGDIKEKFSSALLNRIDYVINFCYLNEKNIEKIIKKRLDLLKNKYKYFKYSNSLVKDIVKESRYKIYGARRIDKIVETRLENNIIDRIYNKQDLNIEHLNIEVRTI